MPEILKLITEIDQKKIQKEFSRALHNYKCEVDIGPEYDTDHWVVNIRTSVPNNKVIETYRKIIAPLIKEIENDLGGEAIWKWHALCKCGKQTEVGIIFKDEDYGPDEDPNEDPYDSCQCDECRTKHYIETVMDICRICRKKYKPYKEEKWRTHFEVHVERSQDLPEPKNEKDKEKQTRKHSEIYEIGFNIHTTPLEKWSVCSRECAKKAYREWLKRILKHPFTKECLEGTKNV